MFVQKGEQLHKPINPNGLGCEIFERFHLHQAQCKNKIALIDAKTKRTITFTQLLEKTAQLAIALNAECTSDDFIAVYSENHINFVLPIISALYLGIPLSPINFNYTGSELLHVLQLSKPKILFASSTVLQKILKICNKCPWLKKIILLDVLDDDNSCYHHGYHVVQGQTQVISMNEFMCCNDQQSNRQVAFRPKKVDCANHILGILCSSGTTGLPKGVVLSHQNVLVRIIQMMDPRYNDINPNDTKLALLPFFHGYGFVATLGHLVSGDTVLVVNGFEERTFLQHIQDYKIRTLYVVPPIIVVLSKSPHVRKYDLSSLKTVYSGAAPLDRKIELAAKRNLNVDHMLQGYGLTEATQATLSFPLPVRNDKPGSAGKILPGMEAAVMDLESGQLLGPNKPGEICFKGPTVMMGYLNNEQATMESFKNGWLISGDIGYYDHEGYFYIIDRRKELIKYKSFQVAPAELEALLLTHPKVQDAAVIGLPDDMAGELPMAFIVKATNCNISDVTREEIMKFVEERVSNAKKLRGGVQFIQEIPKNPSGKILRRELRDLTKKKLISKY